jgi:pimeloyl-ACP methyl ester carboxylesterase
MIVIIRRFILGWRQSQFLIGLLLLNFCQMGMTQNLQVVLPSQTDTNITQFNNYHFVYLNANVTARGQLFVFLPGTGGAPAGYTDVLKTAANLGFHAVGLMYEDPNTMNSLCGDLTNADGYEETRLAVINGGTNAQISIANADSITNRLTKLLLYLTTNDPAQNWNQYLTASANLNWPKIVIAGHSQGAGHSGLIAKTYPVARALMFSDTDWWTPNGQLPGQPADWISSPGVTGDEFYFGFVHVQDPLILYPEEIQTWDDYGLAQFGGPLLVESNSAPYLGSHMLTTDLPPQPSSSGPNYHGATVADAATPLEADGVTPVYQPVWQFMMTGPPELPRLQVAPQNPNQVQIAFGTYTNCSYQLQATTNLLSGWSNSGTAINGDGSQKVMNMNCSGTAQFYRIAVSY